MYNGTAYAYVKSLQGDILAILDENGNAVVSYGYDAWGAPLWCTGELAETLGKVQPFRYRGYVFDEETGLYYLRSRYYNAQWGRFVNADAILHATNIRASFNLYCYCGCEPLGHKDANGYDPTPYEPQTVHRCECYTGVSRSERFDSASVVAPLFYNPAVDSSGYLNKDFDLLYEEHYIVSLSYAEAEGLSRGIIQSMVQVDTFNTIAASTVIGVASVVGGAWAGLKFWGDIALSVVTSGVSGAVSSRISRDYSAVYIPPQDLHISIAHYAASHPEDEYIVYKISSAYSNYLDSDWQLWQGINRSEYDAMTVICDILEFNHRAV